MKCDARILEAKTDELWLGMGSESINLGRSRLDESEGNQLFFSSVPSWFSGALTDDRPQMGGRVSRFVATPTILMLAV